MAEKIAGKIEPIIEGKITSVDQKIDQWYVDNFHGVIGMTTELHNKFYEAKEALKQILKENNA